MDKRELFEKAITQDQQFSQYDLEDLLKMGSFLGRNPNFFKKIYKVYAFQNETTLEFKPEIGAPIIVVFEDEYKQITITRLKAEIKFSHNVFLSFMHLIDACFMELIPLGSVVELDTEYLSNRMKKMIENSERNVMAMIVGHKVGLEERKINVHVDYVAEMWPLGQYLGIPRIFTSNVMIKKIIHRGMTNDFECEFSWKIREQVISRKSRSILFVVPDEKVQKILESEGELKDGK